MADILVQDWMEEFESLTESEIHTYSSEQEHNHEVMIALYDVLAEPYRFKGHTMVEAVCRQLFDFYRSGEEQLRKFTLQYIPCLVFLHLTDKTYASVQTLLVSLYNMEVTDSKGQPRTMSFRVPSIAQSSIYHDSSNLEPAFTAENSLRRWEECNSKLVSWGPLPQVESLNAQNRQRVITALVFLYNQHLASVITQGIEHTCRGISRLLTQGFSSRGSARSSINSDCSYSQGVASRVPVSSPLLLELLHTVYHGAEKGAGAAVQSLHDLMHRASYECYPDVLLAGSAIKNLLQRSATISVTPRPSQSSRSVSKSMITNASFRTKKLPDDIPIQHEHQGDVPLDSITEEHGGEEGDKAKSRGSVSALKHLPNKLAGLGKKHKSKALPSTTAAAHDQVEMGGVTLKGESGGGDPVAESPSSGDHNHSVHVSAV